MPDGGRASVTVVTFSLLYGSTGGVLKFSKEHRQSGCERTKKRWERKVSDVPITDFAGSNAFDGPLSPGGGPESGAGELSALKGRLGLGCGHRRIRG
jgi:hypothetical protein